MKASDQDLIQYVENVQNQLEQAKRRADDLRSSEEMLQRNISNNMRLQVALRAAHEAFAEELKRRADQAEEIERGILAAETEEKTDVTLA